MGPWVVALMTAVCFACVCTAFDLWRGLGWGYRLAILMKVLNLIDVPANVISGSETRALVVFRGLVQDDPDLEFTPNSSSSVIRLRYGAVLHRDRYKKLWGH
jgi:hypothetical protein